MKKCPECGNPSYDGAPVCGNCGFVFPKQKVAAPKKESIFEKEPQKEKKPSSDESTINIIERIFEDLAPKHVKKYYKTLKGFLSRFNLKLKRWDERNAIY